MKADNDRLRRAMTLALLAASGGVALPAALAGQASSSAPAPAPLSSTPAPTVSKVAQRCLKRSVLGKCERRAPTPPRNPPATTAAH